MSDFTSPRSTQEWYKIYVVNDFFISVIDRRYLLDILIKISVLIVAQMQQFTILENLYYRVAAEKYVDSERFTAYLHILFYAWRK